MQAFILDYKLLDEQQLSLGGFLTLLSIRRGERLYNDSPILLKDLEEKGFIKNLESGPILRDKAELFVDFITIDAVAYPQKSKPKTVKTDRVAEAQVNEFIEEYRNKWKGLKPGSRGSLQSCKDKMIRWMKSNPTYTSTQILKAADIYLKSLNSTTYLQQADYFIYKKEGLNESSRLSAFIDEVDDFVSDDWTSTII